ncbi:MAG: hypothetical protein EXR99_08735 [Gemmataceae bacterium]|nr:hypothetical protein [Gemmataceae bacterium]
MTRILSMTFLFALAFPLLANQKGKDTPPTKDQFKQVVKVMGKISGKPGEKGFKLELADDLRLPLPKLQKETEKKRQEYLKLIKQFQSLPSKSPLREKKLEELETVRTEYELFALQQFNLFKKGSVLEVSLQPDSRVRLQFPKSGSFDDKGNIRKYSKSEIAELKGPGNLPGFKASYDDLQEGQAVHLILLQKKAASPGEEDSPEDNPFYLGILMILNKQ